MHFKFYIHQFRFSDKPLSWVNKDKLGLAQHYKVNWTSGSLTETTRQSGGGLNKSTIFLDFTFQRKTGFFIIQVAKDKMIYKQFLSKFII